MDVKEHVSDHGHTTTRHDVRTISCYGKHTDLNDVTIKRLTLNVNLKFTLGCSRLITCCIIIWLQTVLVWLLAVLSSGYRLFSSDYLVYYHLVTDCSRLITCCIIIWLQTVLVSELAVLLSGFRLFSSDYLLYYYLVTDCSRLITCSIIIWSQTQVRMEQVWFLHYTIMLPLDGDIMVINFNEKLMRYLWFKVYVCVRASVCVRACARVCDLSFLRLFCYFKK